MFGKKKSLKINQNASAVRHSNKDEMYSNKKNKAIRSSISYMLDIMGKDEAERTPAEEADFRELCQDWKDLQWFVTEWQASFGEEPTHRQRVDFLNHKKRIFRELQQKLLLEKKWN